MPCDRIELLCEDRTHEMFVRRWLPTLGIGARRIRVTVAPGAGGSAEAFVATQYPRVVKEYRAKANHQRGLGLVVVIDADLQSLDVRSQRLQANLVAAGSPARTPPERICHLIPKRHIETWLRHAEGSDVDEVRDVKREFRDSPPELVALAGQRFDELRRSPHCPLTSLVSTVEETRRLGY